MTTNLQREKPTTETWKCGYCGQSGDNRGFMEKHKCPPTERVSDKWVKKLKEAEEQDKIDSEKMIKAGLLPKGCINPINYARVRREMAESTAYNPPIEPTVRVYKVTPRGDKSSCYLDQHELGEALQSWLEGLSEGEVLEVEPVLMSEKKFNSLPEYEG